MPNHAVLNTFGLIPKPQQKGTFSFAFSSQKCFKLKRQQLIFTPMKDSGRSIRQLKCSTFIGVLGLMYCFTIRRWLWGAAHNSLG